MLKPTLDASTEESNNVGTTRITAETTMVGKTIKTTTVSGHKTTSQTIMGINEMEETTQEMDGETTTQVVKPAKLVRQLTNQPARSQQQADRPHLLDLKETQQWVDKPQVLYQTQIQFNTPFGQPTKSTTLLATMIRTTLTTSTQ